jgi:glycosyltransferase involved in cell wall biosynthesis
MPIINSALTLKDLPAPPPSKTGWPWTEQSELLPERMPDGSEWPRISIVTPSYNQGEFIEETIRSVLLQGYPNLEYIIIDGGSTDKSLEIIRKYEKYLAYWVSEKDSGQANAINKGWVKASGSFYAWLNSDDIYLPNFLNQVATRLTKNTDIRVLYANSFYCDEDTCKLPSPKHPEQFELEDLIFNSCVPQASTLISSTVLKTVGLLNERFHYGFDYHYWIICAANGFKFSYFNIDGSLYRLHQDSKTCSSSAKFLQDWNQALLDFASRIDEFTPIRNKTKNILKTVGMTYLRFSIQCYLNQSDFNQQWVYYCKGISLLMVLPLVKSIRLLLYATRLIILAVLKNIFKLKS